MTLEVKVGLTLIGILWWCVFCIALGLWRLEKKVGELECKNCRR